MADSVMDWTMIGFLAVGVAGGWFFIVSLVIDLRRTLKAASAAREASEPVWGDVPAVPTFTPKTK